jgi:hypothetical protein
MGVSQLYPSAGVNLFSELMFKLPKQGIVDGNRLKTVKPITYL